MSSRFSTILVQFCDICSDFSLFHEVAESKEDWKCDPVLFLLIELFGFMVRPVQETV
jgi:hypothetical protein